RVGIDRARRGAAFVWDAIVRRRSAAGPGPAHSRLRARPHASNSQRYQMMRHVILVAFAVSTVACSRQQAPPFTPGFGEIMTLTQMRHAKLWLAGDAGNWPLAAYELDELKEGFDDLVAYHPTHKDAPVPIAQIVPKMMSAPLKDLEEAVAAKNRE